MRVNVAGVESRNLLGYRAPLLGGDRGVEQTVQVMRRLIDGALSDASFIRFAVDLVRAVPAHDEASEVAAIFFWVQSNIRYTKDPVTKEKLYPPTELLKIRAGDCDDMSMLISALAIALGYPARLVTVSSNPDAPNDFSHVYAEVECPAGSGQWIAVDPARPDSQFGLSPERFFRKRAWSLVDSSYQDLNGYARLSGYARLGQLDPATDQLISQVFAETPQLIAVAQGNPTSSGLVTTGSPYTTFVAPGMVTQPAGYALQTGTSSFGSLLPLLAIAAIAALVMSK